MALKKTLKFYFPCIGELLPRISTSEEVREHKTSLQNVNITPTPKPTTNHISTAIGNHTNTYTAPRVSHSPAPSPQPPAHKPSTLPTAVPPQPAPRKLSQTNGQVRLRQRYLSSLWTLNIRGPSSTA